MLLVCLAALGLSIGLNRFEPLGRPALQRYTGRDVAWLDARPGGALSSALWDFASAGEAGEVIALPQLSLREAEEVGLLELESTFGALPAEAPVPGLRLLAAAARAPIGLDAKAVERRTRAWMRRTLAKASDGLGLCPYTESDAVAGAGLEADGVPPAAVMHVSSDADGTAALLRDFWRACDAMLATGEEGASSIVLSAPAFDGRWDAWCEAVFPALEASVLAAGLSRTLGIVCFHPEYDTPPVAWLATHRFGHMHSDARLRAWVDELEPELSAATSDELLHWAGSYQRRSPHAVVNVLWARQLEAAEGKRKSSRLYAANLRRCLQLGRPELARQAAEERAA